MLGLYRQEPAVRRTLHAAAFLLGFLSNVFVPTQNMPPVAVGHRQTNPAGSAVVAAARQLFGTTQGGAVPDVWSLQHPVVTTVAMGVVLLAVLVPVTVRRYVRRG